MRFGAEEAHGRANMIAFNYITERGGFVFDETTEKFSVKDRKIRKAVRDLLRMLLTIEAEGNYEGAVQLIEQYGEMPENMKKVISKLDHVPVDIRPEFEVLKNL